MEVYEAIEKRRTVRSFKQGIPDAELRKILLAGTKAPSGSNAQPWEFIIVDNPKLIEQIAEHKYQQTLKMTLSDDPKILQQITGLKNQKTLEINLSTERAMNQKNAYRNCTVIAVCNRKEQKGQRKAWMNIENIASTWMCIENMALAATADGLGIVTSIFREEDKVAVEKLLGILEEYELATMVLLGVQGQAPGERMRATSLDASRLHRNKFGTPADR